MAIKKINDNILLGIAGAIRNKLGTEDLYHPSEMPDAIESIQAEAVIESKNISANGTYTAPSGVDGFSPVVVNVPNSYVAGDEGKVVSNGALVTQTSRTIDENGTYDTTLNDEVVVDVAGGGTSDIDTSLLPNSDATKILMSQDDSIASVDHWGRLSLYDKGVTRANPITIGQDGSFQFAGDTFGTFHLSQANVDVTVYALAKVITLSYGDLGILGITYNKSNGNSALFYTRYSAGFYINTSTYGDDTQTQYTINDYALLAVSVNQTTKKARFFINGNYVNEKSFNNTGNQVIFNSFGLSDTNTNVCAFKFMGIVDECESDATVIANMQEIATKLGITI